MITLSTKICIEQVFIYAMISKDTQINTQASYKIDTEYFGEHCVYSYQDNYSYCGDSKLVNCNSCLSPGCSSINCINRKDEEFVY